MKTPAEFPVDRGSDDDQKRWAAELSEAERAENFPPAGSVIVAESPAQAQSIVAELTAEGHRAIARGIYVRTTLKIVDLSRDFARSSPAMEAVPPCMNCRQPFAAHASLPNGDRACPDGQGTFDCEFQISEEAAEFVRANLDKTPEELTRLWIERVRNKTLASAVKTDDET